MLARRQHRELDELGPVRLLLARARQGLAVMRAPLPALKAAAFQFLGWTCQLLAVWSTMRAFHIHQPLAAAGLVLVLMNVATIFPIWPGNVGLVQIAVATPLVNYGVAYAPRHSPSGSACRRSRRRSGSASGSSSSRARGCRTRRCRQIEEPVEESADDVRRTGAGTCSHSRPRLASKAFSRRGLRPRTSPPAAGACPA